MSVEAAVSAAIACSAGDTPAATFHHDQVIKRSSWVCIRCGCVGTTRTLNP